MRLKADRPKPIEFLLRNLRNPRLRSHGLGRALPLVLRGYDVDHIALYDLSLENRGHYPPDFLNYRITTSTNRNVWPILHDKLLFDSFMRDRLPISRLLGAVSGGRWFAVAARGFGPSYLRDGLRGGKAYVLKPLRGGGGHGVRFLQLLDDDQLSLGTDIGTLAGIDRLLSGLPYHGVYERLEQHERVRDLFADATNTLRVLVFRREHEAEPRLLGAQLRVGNRTSAPLDSFFYQGGLSVSVGRDGTTQSAVQRNASGTKAVFTRHPDSGSQLVGVRIPYWDETVAMLFDFHREVPAFDFVGWDVLLGPEGPVVIEGNHNPGLRTLLVHHDLSELPEFRAFCVERRLLAL